MWRIIELHRKLAIDNYTIYKKATAISDTYASFIQ